MEKKYTYLAIILIVMLIFVAVVVYINGIESKNTINQARELANKTITENMSMKDKVLLSKTACDIYYFLEDKPMCFEQVIKEHV